MSDFVFPLWISYTTTTTNTTANTTTTNNNKVKQFYTTVSPFSVQIIKSRFVIHKQTTEGI